MEILYILIGCLFGAIALYLVLKPKLKSIQQIDEAIKAENEKTRIELNELSKQKANLIAENEKVRYDYNELSKQYAVLNAKKEEIISSISALQQQAEESGNALYEKSYQLASEHMSEAAELMAQKYQKAQLEAEKEYTETLNDYQISFQKQIGKKKKELDEVNAALADLNSKLTIAVEASKRAQEIKEKQDFYRLQLSQSDIDEIKRLREVLPYLRDKEPLNKVIWKVYYEKPTTDLIGRVIGPGAHTGIYKITNIENQMCYVGQAANLADRWKQHIKRGIGAEMPTRNKLYPAMLENGVENFTFEVVEKCDRGMLNEREDYWQQYFHAMDYGYSIK